MKKLFIIICALLLTACSANNPAADMDENHPFHKLDGSEVSLVEFKGEPNSIKDSTSNSRTVTDKKDIVRLVDFLKSGTVERTEKTEDKYIGASLEVKFYDKNNEILMKLSHLSKEGVNIESNGITYVYYYEAGYLDKLVEAIPYTLQ